MGGLIGHLFGSALIFCTFALLAWGIAVFVHALNSYHEFPVEIYAILTRIEVWLIYVDVLLSGVVLVAGTIRFVRDIFWEMGL